MGGFGGASSSAQTFSLQVITHYLAVLLTANLSCLSNRLTYRIAQTKQLNSVYDMCHNEQAVVLHAEAVSSYLR